MLPDANAPIPSHLLHAGKEHKGVKSSKDWNLSQWSSILLIFHLLCNFHLWKPFLLHCSWPPSWGCSGGVSGRTGLLQTQWVSWALGLLSCWMQRTQQQGFPGHVWHDQTLTWKTWTLKLHHEFLHPYESGRLLGFLRWCTHFWKIWFPQTSISHHPPKKSSLLISGI